MATVINKAKLKEMGTIEGQMDSLFQDFKFENSVATNRTVISSAKRARAISGKLGKLCKEYRRVSLAAFDKDPETKKKMATKRAERKANKGSDPTAKSSKKKKK